MCGMLLIAACTQEIEEGEFQFLRVGATKEEVMEAAAGIRAITPTNAKPVHITKETLSDLEELKGSKALHILDQKNYSLQLIFEDQKVAEISSSPQSETRIPAPAKSIYVGQDMAEVLSVIEAILKAHPQTTARSFVPNRRAVILSSATAEDIAYLKTHDGWVFHGLETHSTFNLYFDDNKLVRI